MERLVVFANSVPDFRRTNKGNIRHKLGGIIILMIFARLSCCVDRADIIAYGEHNLNKLRSMNLLKNGVPPEPTLCCVESGIDAAGFSDRMTEFAQYFDEELLKTCAFIEIIHVTTQLSVHLCKFKTTFIDILPRKNSHPNPPDDYKNNWDFPWPIQRFSLSL